MTHIDFFATFESTLTHQPRRGGLNPAPMIMETLTAKAVIKNTKAIEEVELKYEDFDNVKLNEKVFPFGVNRTEKYSEMEYFRLTGFHIESESILLQRCLETDTTDEELELLELYPEA